MRSRSSEFLFVLCLLFLSTTAKISYLVLSEDGEASPAADLASPSDYDSSDVDDFDPKSEEELDRGSWRPIFEPNLASFDPANEDEAMYYSGVKKMVAAVSSGERRVMEEAASEIEAAAARGYPHAQSALGFLYSLGMSRERDGGKAFMYHYFAADGGNTQSKMALAYTYYSQNMYNKAAELYAELAETAINSFLISKAAPVIELVRIHTGAAENKGALRRYRGEEDEDFQVVEYQAEKGNVGAMYKIGTFYYFGLRGVKRDHVKALSWILKAVEKGEPNSMELLSEMYARGAGVERNYTRAFLWLKFASNRQLYSAYNGMGYFYVKGYGMDKKNYTKAKEYFEIAADNNEASGNYNLGKMYLKGIGVKRNVKQAHKYFELAALVGQPKALYQLAKMFHSGVGFKLNLPMAIDLYKQVAEMGPWSSLSRWALESYLKGDVGKALLLYLRMAELGYEVAQSNAAWIIDQYEDGSMCMGESGFCTEAEKYRRARSLWWQASEQNNEHAALVIGDAYYYGRGIERDFGSAAEAYKRATSNAQAMFNLGYMHEHGQGLPFDIHLAKRYYDLALQKDPAAKLPVAFALASLWIRKHYANSFLVNLIDSLPEVFPEAEAWVENVIMEEGNATILSLFVCLLTVLYLRERQRRQAVGAAREVPPPQQFNDPIAPLAN